jgi:flavorubredoxin
VDRFGTRALYEDESHKFYLLGWEEEEEEGIVQVNQYIIVDGNEAVLLDPGGAHVFARVLAEVSEVVDLENVRHVFFTHQDPDVVSGVTLWLSILPNAKVYMSSLWVRFLPHFGIYDQKRIVAVPDKGGRIRLSSGVDLKILPAHYLHSTGNLVLYDPVARILFSGDIGAAIFPKGGRYQIAENWEEHVKLMEAFHQRYMTSNTVCKKWVDVVKKFDIDYIAPQHGAVMPKEVAMKFLEWLKNLKCGIDILDRIYG